MDSTSKETKWETITDAHWQRELKRTRGLINDISTQIKVKLHPTNPTPGINMITFNPLTTFMGLSYACLIEDRSLGYLHKDNEGTFHFYANHIHGGKWSEGFMKEIANKLHDLNAGNVQKMLGEAYGHSTFTD